MANSYPLELSFTVYINIIIGAYNIYIYALENNICTIKNEEL